MIDAETLDRIADLTLAQGLDEGTVQALRAAWQFYKERGYALEKHDL